MLRTGCALTAAGTAALTATAVLLAAPPATQPTTVHRSAHPVAALAPLTADPLEPAPSPAQALDFADAVELLAPSAAAASGLGESLQALYLGAEQWVGYGVNLLTWAIGWIPFGGLLAAQINIFYDLGESILRSTVFNTIDVLTGTVGLGQALSNIAGDTSIAFNDFFTAQANWFTSLLPPPPPVLPGADAAPDGNLDPAPDLAGSDLAS